jgi:F420-non-reducing hydrogenase small subunit
MEGGIPGLANLSTKQAILDTAFSTISTDNPKDLRPQTNYKMPEGMLHIPAMYEIVKALDQVVPVDYYMPGCPPESPQIAAVVGLVIQALKGEAQLPPPGSVIGASNSTVCDECKRARNEKAIAGFERMATFQPRTDQCLLEQGILCAGMATRGGCDARCPSANIPCHGCYGPAPDVVDQGARMMSAVASVIASKDPVEIDRIMNGIVDPVGTFYRFSLPHSLMRRAKANGGEHATHHN